MEESNPALADIRLAVVCPMANERETAVRFVNSVLEHCKGFKQVTFFAILDHACKDGTFDILKDLEKQQPRLNVIWAPEDKCGVDAYIRGYGEAIEGGYDWILEIDGGFSHQPCDIPQFFDKMLQGYDCVFGSRFCSGGSMLESPLKRRILSRGGTILTNILLGAKLKDMTSGFEMFSRSALEMVMARGIESRGHFFQTEIRLYCHKLKIVEVPITYRAPSDSINKGMLKDAFDNLLRLVRLRISGNL